MVGIPPAGRAPTAAQQPASSPRTPLGDRVGRRGRGSAARGSRLGPSKGARPERGPCGGGAGKESGARHAVGQRPSGGGAPSAAPWPSRRSLSVGERAGPLASRDRTCSPSSGATRAVGARGQRARASRPSLAPGIRRVETLGASLGVGARRHPDGGARGAHRTSLRGAPSLRPPGPDRPSADPRRAVRTPGDLLERGLSEARRAAPAAAAPTRPCTFAGRCHGSGVAVRAGPGIEPVRSAEGPDDAYPSRAGPAATALPGSRGSATGGGRAATGRRSAAASDRSAG
jgi:hypothetical protein